METPETITWKKNIQWISVGLTTTYEDFAMEQTLPSESPCCDAVQQLELKMMLCKHGVFQATHGNRPLLDVGGR